MVEDRRRFGEQRDSVDDTWLRALGEWEAAHRQAARSARDRNQLVLWELPDLLHAGGHTHEHAVDREVTHS